VGIDNKGSLKDPIPAVVVLQGGVMSDGWDLTVESILCAPRKWDLPVRAAAQDNVLEVANIVVLRSQQT
jgi:hypothetical protein